ncbi:MAG: MATE family efflux transporter [Myxococcota bacterium]
MRPLLSELSATWRLAWPISLAMLAMMGMGVVDTLATSRLGGDAMAAVQMATSWYFGVGVLLFGALRAVDPIVSQAHGAGDPRAIGRALASAMGLALACTPVWVVALLAAGPGLAFFEQPAAQIPAAARFCAVLALGVPGSLLFSALRQVLQGIGVVRPATVVLTATVVLNAVLVYALVFHLGGGTDAVAAATACCNWFSLFALAWATRSTWRPMVAAWPSLAEVGRLAWFGAPLGVQMAMEAWAFIVSSLFVGQIGATPLAAHAVVANCVTVSFMIPLGVGNAAATRVGNLIGAGEPWGRAAVASLLLGGGAMVVSGAVYSLVPGLVAGLYDPEPAVRDLVVLILPIGGAFQLFDGIQVVAFGILRGAGDYKLPSLANLVGYWIVGLPFGWWLAHERGWGAAGIWTGLGVALALVAVLLLVRVRWTWRRGGFRV